MVNRSETEGKTSAQEGQETSTKNLLPAFAVSSAALTGVALFLLSGEPTVAPEAIEDIAMIQTDEEPAPQAAPEPTSAAPVASNTSDALQLDAMPQASQNSDDVQSAQAAPEPVAPAIEEDTAEQATAALQLPPSMTEAIEDATAEDTSAPMPAAIAQAIENATAEDSAIPMPPAIAQAIEDATTEDSAVPMPPAIAQAIEDATAEDSAVPMPPSIAQAIEDATAQEPQTVTAATDLPQDQTDTTLAADSDAMPEPADPDVSQDLFADAPDTSGSPAPFTASPELSTSDLNLAGLSSPNTIQPDTVRPDLVALAAPSEGTIVAARPDMPICITAVEMRVEDLYLGQVSAASWETKLDAVRQSVQAVLNCNEASYSLDGDLSLAESDIANLRVRWDRDASNLDLTIIDELASDATSATFSEDGQPLEFIVQ